MKWVELVPDRICTTPIKVLFENGLNEDGSPHQETVFSGNCNYSEKAKTVFDGERKAVRLSAVALFNGDISPGKDIEGCVEVGNTTRRIFSFSRGRNPDGTVNFTQLELI
jgi:hypothetical protein